MKRLSVPALLLAMALSAFAPATAAAAQPSDPGTNLVAPSNCPAGTGRGGAAALAALVAVALGNVNVGPVCVLNDSLNNLLQNANINALNNILNNSPILNDLNISDIEVLRGGINVTILSGGLPVVVFIPLP